MKWRLKLLTACLIALAFLLPALAQAGQGTYATLDGHKVYYTDQGQGKPTLMLIHCWTCNHNFWREQVPALSKSHRVIAIDLIGHGKSDAPKLDYTQALFLRSMLAVMDQAQVKDAVLIGNSMGAALARRMALEHPERVRAVVSVDGALQVPPQDKAAYEQWLQRGQAFAAQFEGPDGQQKAGQMMEAFQGKQTPPAIKEWVRTQSMATPWHVGRSSMNEFIRPENWDRRQSDVPLLAIYAEGPNLQPGYDKQLRILFPNLSYHTVSGVGHFLMLEKPVEINALILDFVDSKAVREKKTSK